MHTANKLRVSVNVPRASVIRSFLGVWDTIERGSIRITSGTDHQIKGNVPSQVIFHVQLV